MGRSDQAGLAALKDTYGADRLETPGRVPLSGHDVRKRATPQIPAHHADLVREIEQITTDVTGEQARS